MDPSIKAASKQAIDLLSKHYPETMRRKLFLNVPTVMGWMFAAMRLFVSAETAAKFTVVAYGNQLANEIGHADEVGVVFARSFGPDQPVCYSYQSSTAARAPVRWPASQRYRRKNHQRNRIIMQKHLGKRRPLQ